MDEFHRYQINKVLNEVREAIIEAMNPKIDQIKVEKVRKYIEENMKNPKKEKTKLDEIVEEIILKENKKNQRRTHERN